jgi:hypothetical protein
MGRSPYHERDSNPLQNQNPLVMMGKLLEMTTAHQSLSLTPSLPDASAFFQLKGLFLPSLTTFVCRQFFGNFSHSNPLFSDSPLTLKGFSPWAAIFFPFSCGLQVDFSIPHAYYLIATKSRVAESILSLRPILLIPY